MRLLLALLWLLSANGLAVKLYNGTTAKLWNLQDDIGQRFGCDHTSFSVVKCIQQYVDTNRDDGVTEQEIDAAKSRYMHWWEKLVDNVVNAGSSLDIRKRCDLNENGKIDVDDLIVWNHECSKFPNDAAADAYTGKLCLCNCEAIDAISKYICDRAKSG